VVDKSGSWFSYGSERIGQGRENAKVFLREHPDMTNEIEALIRQNAGLVSDAMMVAESTPISDDDDELSTDAPVIGADAPTEDEAS